MNEQQVAREAATFEQLKAQSIEALRIKLEAHRWWLEDYDEWSLDQNAGILVIHTHSRGEPMVARAAAQIIGSFNKADGSWLWGWANSSIADSLKADAELVRQLGDDKSFPKLTERKVPTDQQGAFGFAAVASHACGSQGVFSAAAGDAVIYINFGQVSLEKDDLGSSATTGAPPANRRLKILLAIFAALFILPILGAIIAIVMGR